MASQSTRETRPYSLVPASILKRLDLDDAVDVLPCTPMQGGLMALSVKKPRSHTALYLYKLGSRTDVRRFESCWEATVSACETLRTKIMGVDGKAYQVITKSITPWEDTRGGTMALDDVVAAARGCDMTYGSRLSRHALVTVDVDTYFVWLVHLAICDLWSIGVIQETLHKIYWGEVIHHIPPFSRFVRYLDTISSEASNAYWRRELQDAVPLMFPPTRGFDHDADMHVHKLHLQFALPVDSIITETNLVRAAWAAVLGRRNRSANVIFGAAVTGRTAPVHELGQMTGPTVATVPVRLALWDSITIGGFLRTVQQHSDATVPHEQLGLRNIAKVSPSAKEACNFGSLVVIQPREFTSELDDIGLAIMTARDDEYARMYRERTHFFTYPLVLVVHMGPNPGHVAVDMYYNTSILTDLQVRVLAHQLAHVTEQLVGDQTACLETVSLISEWDRSLGLHPGRFPTAPQWCVHWLIDERARMQPYRPAISSHDGEVSYGQLLYLSAKLAAHIQRLGQGPESVVALCFPKSLWSVVAMLAVLMAGAAFVPLEPHGIAKKLRKMTKEAGCKVILTTPCRQGLSASLSLEQVIVTEDFVEALPDPVEPITSEVHPENASFVIYTSASTASSKGIPHTHSSLVAAAHSFNTARQWGPHDRVLQYLPYTFDMGILDVIVSLCYGACICIPTEHECFFDLPTAINRTRATLLSVIPTGALGLVPEAVPTLRTLLLSGEEIPQALVERWAGRAEVHGAYGPAETSVCAWRTDLHRSPDSVRNVGMPLNSVFWVIDPDKPEELVPVGGIGELVVHNASLGRGYYKASQEANSNWLGNVTWIQNPDRAPVRAFRTGDLVRRNENGSFDFLGRLDSQVNYRGRKVELGCVERLLQEALPSNMDGTVVIIMDKMNFSYDLTVVLWYKGGPMGEGPKFEPFHEVTTDMRSLICSLHMAAECSLQRFLIPDVYIVYEGCPPLTLSGKVDKRTLRRKACKSHGNVSKVFNTKTVINDPQAALPTTRAELQLRDLWASVLRVTATDINLHSNFFHLGGDSFSAIEVSKRSRVLGWKLTVPAMFRNPHLSSMTAAIIFVSL